MKLTLGEKLKDERIKKKLTSKQVCEEIERRYGYKLSVGKYNEMESDVDKDFGYRAFIYLSKLFEVSADYLLGLADNPSIDPDIQKAREVTGLSDEALKAIVDLNLKQEEDLYTVIDLFFTSKSFSKLLWNMSSIFYENISMLYYQFLIDNSNILTRLESENLDVEYIEKHILDYFNSNHFHNFQFSLPDAADIYIDWLDLANYRTSKTFAEVIKEFMSNSKYTINMLKENNSLLLHDIEKDLLKEGNEIVTILKENEEYQKHNPIDNTMDKFIEKTKQEYECKLSTFDKFKELVEMEVLENAQHNPKEE